MRSEAIHYMCQLSDKDLRLVGTKNTTELMYESFKDLNNYYIYDLITNNSSSSSSSTIHSNSFKIDKDGLMLAIKYFLCSTLTIRLCGITQMNVINKYTIFIYFFNNDFDI
jgi:hypothetical protein